MEKWRGFKKTIYYCIISSVHRLVIPVLAVVVTVYSYRLQKEYYDSVRVRDLIIKHLDSFQSVLDAGLNAGEYCYLRYSDNDKYKVRTAYDFMLLAVDAMVVAGDPRRDAWGRALIGFSGPLLNENEAQLSEYITQPETRRLVLKARKDARLRLPLGELPKPLTNCHQPPRN